jgi:hypothetical protein
LTSRTALKKQGGLDTMKTIVLLAATLLLPIPPPDVSVEPIGSPRTSPELRVVDQAVRAHGIDERYNRDVTWMRVAPESRKRDPARFPEFAVVDYLLGSQRLRDGVQVWIDRHTGEAAIVPKRFIRSAHRAMLDAGYDPTLYTWYVRSVGEELRFHYRPRPPRRQLRRRGRGPHYRVQPEDREAGGKGQRRAFDSPPPHRE